MTSAPAVPSFTPSENIARLQESATIAVSQRAKALRAAGHKIIDLGAGEPDFDTPPFIRTAAKRALDDGATRYTPVEGILPLRQAIADEANERWRGSDRVVPAEVVVSTGSKQSLFNACFSLFGHLDEVLIPTPSWTSYYEMVTLARATVVPVMGDPASGFKVTAEELERHASPRTRGLMLNSPSNPTGAVYSAGELRDILALATEREWWTISDEIYLRIAYGTPAASSLDVAPARERLVVVNGVAKAFAMTGWRIGWSISAAPLARAMTALQSHTTSNAAAVSQHAALAALTMRREGDAAVEAMVAEFQKRRDAALAILRQEPRLQVLAPDGAFYLYLRAPQTTLSPDPGAAFAAHLLETAGVAVVPGSAFCTPEWVRVSYAADQSQVAEAMRRIVAAFRALA
ncbi:MAG TPA: pyridoxal phosphate-dependent aminotransferase [Gemmatimonadaceae bacterium]|nr:pyridoxal phosphate-dependent aminotransferase [Gemmatimonadaceae bacterium]